MDKTIFATIIYIAVLALPFIITFLKKRNQLGKVWSGPLSATLRIAGVQLCCKHCGNNRFQKREGILVTSWVAFFRFIFWNQSATCYTWIHCKHVEWFVRPKEEDIKFERNEYRS